MKSASGWALLAVLLACTVGIAVQVQQPAPAPLPGGPGPGPAPVPQKGDSKTDAAPAKVAPAPIDPAVAALVADLGSEDYQTREAAGKKLAAMGEKALPDLKRAL